MSKRGFVIHHNGPEAKCVGATHARCIAFWEAVKRYHMQSKGWSDIAYSFGVCPHGVRFTGRGWFKNQFANGADVVGPNDGKDSEWFTVLVFLGGNEAPTPEMVQGVKNLIIDGRSLGRCGMRVLPHNAFKPKACPGPEFTALSAVWDNNPTLQITQVEDDWMAALSDKEQRELLDRIRSLTPFSKERFNRVGRLLADDEPGGVVADPSVRWMIETVILARAEANKVRSIVRDEVQKAVSNGGVDPEQVADNVVAAIAERLAT